MNNRYNQSPSGSPKKGTKGKVEKEESKSINETFKQMIARVQREFRGNSFKQVYIIVLPTFDDVNQELSYGLRDRLANKKNSLLIAPRQDDSHEPPRALSIDELNELIDLDFPRDSTTIYLSGHSNNRKFSSHKVEDLARKLGQFLEATGIKKIKLAGCDTASAYYEEECLGAKDIGELTVSYAKRLSLAFVINDVMDVEVYGYRGEIQDRQQKTRHSSTNSHMRRCYASFYYHEDGGSLADVRASETRIGYKNGEIIKDPVLTADIYEKVPGEEGEAPTYRRMTYNKT